MIQKNQKTFVRGDWQRTNLLLLQFSDCLLIAQENLISGCVMSSFNVDTTSDAVSGLKISDAPREVVFLSPEKPITLKEVAMVAKNLSLVSVEEDVYTQMDSAYTNMVSVSGKEEDGKVDISVESLSLSGVSSSGNRFICRAALLMKLVALRFL